MSAQEESKNFSEFRYQRPCSQGSNVEIKWLFCFVDCAIKAAKQVCGAPNTSYLLDLVEHVSLRQEYGFGLLCGPKIMQARDGRQ